MSNKEKSSEIVAKIHYDTYKGVSDLLLLEDKQSKELKSIRKDIKDAFETEQQLLEDKLDKMKKAVVKDVKDLKETFTTEIPLLEDKMKKAKTSIIKEVNEISEKTLKEVKSDFKNVCAETDETQKIIDKNMKSIKKDFKKNYDSNQAILTRNYKMMSIIIIVVSLLIIACLFTNFNMSRRLDRLNEVKTYSVNETTKELKEFVNSDEWYHWSMTTIVSTEELITDIAEQFRLYNDKVSVKYITNAGDTFCIDFLGQNITVAKIQEAWDKDRLHYIKKRYSKIPNDVFMNGQKQMSRGDVLVEYFDIK